MRSWAVGPALIGWSIFGVVACGGRSQTDDEPDATRAEDPAPCLLCSARALLCTGPLESNDATRSALTGHGCQYESAGVSLQIDCASGVTCPTGFSCGDISTSDTTIMVSGEDGGLGFECWPSPP